MLRAYLGGPVSAREAQLPWFEPEAAQVYIACMGTLYVVGTPIGNLEDITLRAARVLGEVRLVAAEDTRITRRLLSHLGIRAPLTSCNEHNWPAKLPDILRELEKGDVALTTDAGMPAVSDPGAAVVNRVSEAGFRIEVIPGPSAVTSALAVSGMPADSFLFLGFLPRRRKERRLQLASAATATETLVVFEAPHRLRATLADLLAELGDRPIAVCRELTKFHEEIWRGPTSGALDHFTSPRGEIALVVAGAEEGDKEPPTEAAADSARRELAALRGSGARAREAVNAVAASTGLPRKDVYRLWLETANTCRG